MNTVKTKRCELNMTQRQLACAANISQAAISKIESGASDPSLALAKLLAHILDCTVEELFRRYLKTKKMTNISQRRGRFEAKTLRNPSGFQVFLTKKRSAFVEIVKIFDFSDTP